MKKTNLQLGISESIIREASEAVSAIFSQLKTLGVRKSQIDNCDRNYSPDQDSDKLSCFIEKQFDRLKMDYLLISRIGQDPGSLNRVYTIALNAHSSGMKMTVACVETAQQVAHLKEMQCRYGQGYLFSKPLEHGVAIILIRT